MPIFCVYNITQARKPQIYLFFTFPKYFVWEDKTPAWGNNQEKVCHVLYSNLPLPCCPPCHGSFLLLQFFHAKASCWQDINKASQIQKIFKVSGAWEIVATWMVWCVHLNWLYLLVFAFTFTLATFLICVFSINSYKSIFLGSYLWSLVRVHGVQVPEQWTLFGCRVDRCHLLSAGSFPFMISSKEDWSGRNKIKCRLNVHGMDQAPATIPKIIYNKCNTHRVKTIVSDARWGSYPPHSSPVLLPRGASCNHFWYWLFYWVSACIYSTNECWAVTLCQVLLGPVDKVPKRKKKKNRDCIKVFTY